jgi:hypothetical protein
MQLGVGDAGAVDLGLEDVQLHVRGSPAAGLGGEKTKVYQRMARCNMERGVLLPAI